MTNQNKKKLFKKNGKLFQSLFISLGLVQALAGADVRASADEEGGGNLLERTTGVPVHGFANMGYAVDSSSDNHRRYARGFYLNNFDLYFSPDLGSRVRFLSEVVFEPDAADQSPGFDAERLQAGYVVSKNLTAWIGRFHTPIGYYVLAYHHGMQLQTAVEKPRFLDFEDHYGVLPVHSNGLWLNGNATLGDERLALMAWISNSDRITTDGNGFSSLDFNMVHNENHKLGVGARVNWISGGIDGLQAGVMVLHQTVDSMGGGGTTYSSSGGTNDVDSGSASSVNPNTGGTFSSNFLMAGMHLVYEGHGIEFINEIYGFHNSDYLDPSGQTYNSAAGFSQLAYWINGVSAPYVRYERGSFNVNDPYFAGQYNGLPYSKWAVGYRYNLDENAAVKVEYSKVAFNASSATNTGQGYDDIHLDYSIRF